jgi:glucose uptake protein GlcU
MSETLKTNKSTVITSVHSLGVACALAAGVWLGAAEAPTKLVNSGLSPFAISLAMVAGVFTARWTIPTLLKGTTAVFADLSRNRHLIPIAVLAGMLWAVANTLTVFAIRDVGLAIAFPLWNANSLVGIFWGWLLFGELRGAPPRTIAKVLLGALAILAAAIMLGFSTLQADTHQATTQFGGHALSGILAAIGASLLWGTMYVPYRKAYISGMSPLSFVTIFTIGELVTCFTLVLALDGGTRAPIFHSPEIRHVLFWLFLGGFVWVIGDIFQQYATKFLGIGRGIPLANTNQLWGLAWGALVFGELSHADWSHCLLVLFGSLVMIAGALAVSSAVASAKENAATNTALLRECKRYGLDYNRALAAQSGIPQPQPDIHQTVRYPLNSASESPHTIASNSSARRWWDYLIVAVAIGVFVWLGLQAHVPTVPMNFAWIAILAAFLVASALAAGYGLWKANRFS